MQPITVYGIETPRTALGASVFREMHAAYYRLRY